MNVKIFVLVFAMGIAAVGIVGCETQNPICTENFCVTGEVFPRSAFGAREFSEVDIDDSRLLAALAGIPEPTTPVDETVDNTLVELENNSNFVPISLLLSKPADYNKQIIVTRAYVNEIFIYDDGSKSAVLGVKCQRLLGPKFRKVKTSFFPEIRQVLNTLMPSEGVCDYTPV